MTADEIRRHSWYEFRPTIPETEPMQIEGVKIDVQKVPRTELLLATSEDMRGLFVAGRTMREVLGRTPEAIRSIRAISG